MHQPKPTAPAFSSFGRSETFVAGLVAGIERYAPAPVQQDQHVAAHCADVLVRAIGGES